MKRNTANLSLNYDPKNDELEEHIHASSEDIFIDDDTYCPDVFTISNIDDEEGICEGVYGVNPEVHRHIYDDSSISDEDVLELCFASEPVSDSCIDGIMDNLKEAREEYLAQKQKAC